MKKILQLTKAIILTLAAVIMLLNTNVLTAQAGIIMFPDSMIKTEDGRIMPINGYSYITTDSTGREWYSCGGYPFCVYEEPYEEEFRGQIVTAYRTYLDYYLTDYIETHEESEWPSFVVKGSDGIPFYYSLTGQYTNGNSYAKFCYDKESGWWFEDKSYKGPSKWSCPSADELAQETKKDLENGEIINGAPEEPVTSERMDEVAEYNPDDDTITYRDGRVTYSDGRTEYPDGRMVYPDGYVEYMGADFNSLGATVTFKTDCIKAKENNAAQKPLPKSVKVGKKALKRNKNYTVSYEKYAEGWKTVDAVTDEGIYRIVLTGKGDYKGVYKKTLYVTADKDIKAMSSVSVKVNKMEYTGEPIKTGVIKTAKIGKRTLEAGVDYTAIYTNNTDSGTAQVTLIAIEGKGLLGTKTVNFTITGNKLSKAKVTGINR